jgi:hypothetical protein
VSEDDRTALRRLSFEHLEALHGILSEREWALFEVILARLLRLETGSFEVEEVPTKPAKRFSSTEKGLTPSGMPSVLDPNRLGPKRHDSTARWTSEEAVKILEGAREEAGLEKKPK